METEFQRSGFCQVYARAWYFVWRRFLKYPWLSVRHHAEYFTTWRKFVTPVLGTSTAKQISRCAFVFWLGTFSQTGCKLVLQLFNRVRPLQWSGSLIVVSNEVENGSHEPHEDW